MDVFTYKGILPDCSFKSTQMQIFDPDCNLTPTNTCLNIFKWLLTHEV